MKAAEFITEAFDQPYNLRWEKGDHGNDHDAIVLLPDGRYLSIMFNEEDEDEYSVEFWRGTEQSVTGEGDAQRIFATVLSAIAEFIKKYHPRSLSFEAAKKDQSQQSDSRAKLYDRLVQRYANGLGYRVDRWESGHGVNYNLTRLNQGVAESKQPGKPVVDAILKVMPVAQEIWLHGSRATGRHRRNSDTDILVVVPDDLVGDQYLAVVRILQKLASHFDNYDIQPTKSGTNIHRIAQEEGRLLWSSKQGVAESRENFNGIDISLEIQKDDEYVDDEDYDNQVIYVTASSNGRELGHVLFAFDGEYLMPQDLEVEERFRGQGIAQTMYDYVKSKGYKIRRSGQQTDAGAGFWDKHKGQGQNVWEQGLNEFAPDGFNGGDDGEEFNPRMAKMAYEAGIVKGASLADGATLERAMAIDHWDSHDGGMYKQYFAKGFKQGRMNKIKHDNKQYNLNLKLMKDGSIRHGKQGVAENFADGKNPGRKGLAKRSGVDCKQSISKLRSIAAHSSGERQRMAHWCANMKSGKKK